VSHVTRANVPTQTEEQALVNKEIRDRIDGLIKNNSVVLFMKGNRAFPQCGFSARVVELLEKYVDSFETVNVLEDADLRSELKEYTDWPTFPQLYVKGKFIGGSDIVADLDQQGQLEHLLERPS
jgi:monothiol glutaredoxin